MLDIKYVAQINVINRIGGSVVECSPATRAARVRFPADANLLVHFGPASIEVRNILAIFARSITFEVVLR